MVERRVLTPAFVSRAVPPTKGERWVSDIKLKGFGLRLWTMGSKAGAAFAIRVTSKDGRCIRKTFRFQESQTYRSHLGQGAGSIALGHFLDEAREWARDEIDQIKGRPTLDEEKQVRWRKAQARIQRLTFGRAAESLIVGMRGRGLSQAYVDRIDKLFATHIPAPLQKALLREVSAKDIAEAIVNTSIRPGNIRTLRSFIGQIFKRGSEFYGPLGRFSEDLSDHFWKRWDAEYKIDIPELAALKDTDYQRIFKKLEAQESRWQQALCIRLFFKFGAPLSRLMSARWAQVLEKSWYPYWPDERVYWFESQERIDDIAAAILDRVAFLARKDFGASELWFPSHFGRSAQHIRTVDPVWRDTLDAVGSRYYPLREFALSYRRPNNPSYHISFLNQYGVTFREMQNAAKLSEALEQRRKLISKSVD